MVGAAWLRLLLQVAIGHVAVVVVVVLAAAKASFVFSLLGEHASFVDSAESTGRWRRSWPDVGHCSRVEYPQYFA